MPLLLDQEIMYLKGVGPKKAGLLASELNLHTCRDLIFHFPYKYIDRSQVYRISEANTQQAYIQFRGRISHYRLEGPRYKQRLVAVFSDDTGSIDLVWFQGIQRVMRDFPPGIEYIAFGRPGNFNGRISIAHPELEPATPSDSRQFTPLQPQYGSTEKLKHDFIHSKYILKLILQVLPHIPDSEETLPVWLVDRLRLMSWPEAIRNIHLPSGSDKLRKAIYRLKFEELFYIQLSILAQKNRRQARSEGIVFSRVGEHLNHFYQVRLSFELTSAQKRVVREIRKDMGSGRQMNRLLQGDVGSGKTLVALMSMLIALDNGYQSCLMAPTELLAMQHFNTFSRWLQGSGVIAGLLTGSTSRPEREKLMKGLQDESLHILIGTHALIEDSVKFGKLGLVIIDEQHRFGVEQRARLWTKSNILPHVLVMTATPIPRTLAMTVYGDLDVSVIDELPPGRKPIQTLHFYESRRLVMFGFLRQQIELGRQVYVVYPLIRESEKLDYVALEQGYEAITRAFPPPRYAVVCVHGQMKTEEREEGMQLFIKGKAHIMVATTVIEVGVDIPNASVMVIENAERFGLSQLHQLRGRVGRGAEQSHCILMTGYKLSREGRKRIETMVRTQDGFEIADTDLKIRGPGDIEGTQQSGMPFDLKLTDLAQDGQIIQFARDMAQEILQLDPNLEKEESAPLLRQLKKLSRTKVDWSSVG